jgi:hypothetical protein
MRKIFLTSFTAALFFVGMMSVATPTHAAIGDACTENNDQACDPATSYCSLIRNSPNYNKCVPNSQMVADQATSQSSVNATTGGEGKPNTETPAQKEEAAYNSIMVKIMGLFAWLLGVSAVTLDYAVYYTVVKMGEYVKSLSAIGVAWRILRDLGNIALIFGFLAIGINTILGTEAYGWGQKLLPRLLMAAVALNFSLFFTEAIIDTGNLFATQFYTQIKGGGPLQLSSGSMSKIDMIQNEGISNKLMGKLGLQNIYGKAVNNNVVLTGTNPFFIGFMGILLFITAAFVMFSLAFILIARFVALIFIIILAPIGVVGFAVPKLSGIAGKWRDQLISQTLTAPVLMLMLYIALAVITDAQFLAGYGSGGTPEWTGIFTGSIDGFASVLLSFLVAMGLLLAVTAYAKQLGAVGAAMATKTAGRVVGGFTGGAIGGLALAGRGTFGLVGRGLNSKGMQARAAGSGLVANLSKVGAFAGRNLEKRTYDLRNVRALGSVGGALTGALAGGGFGDTGFGSVSSGMGKGTSMTAKQTVDKTVEGYKTYKPFTGDWWRNQQREYELVADEQKRKSNLSAAVSPTIPPNPASVAAQKELKKMSADELSKLSDIRNGIDRLVYNLSPEKFSELMKSDKLLAGEKGKLKRTWDSQFDPTLGATSASAAISVGRLSTEEVVALGGGTLTHAPVIDNLGANEFDAIRRKGSLDKNQRRTIHAHMIAAPAGSTLKAEVDAYFDPANDVGGNRKRYWDV